MCVPTICNAHNTPSPNNTQTQVSNLSLPCRYRSFPATVQHFIRDFCSSQEQRIILMLSAWLVPFPGPQEPSRCSALHGGASTGSGVELMLHIGRRQSPV